LIDGGQQQRTLDAGQGRAEGVWSIEVAHQQLSSGPLEVFGPGAVLDHRADTSARP